MILVLCRARINDPYGSLLTQGILWINNSNLVLLHMYIRYMEVSNLASHTNDGVYFKKLSPSIALYTDQHFYFCHITHDFQCLWTTATKFIWNCSLWPDNFLTYIHYIQPLSSPPYFLPQAVKIWWTPLLLFIAGMCSTSRTRQSPSSLCLLVDAQPPASVHSLFLSITLSLRVLY